LEYADRVSATPVDVPDEFFAYLQRLFSERELFVDLHAGQVRGARRHTYLPSGTKMTLIGLGLAVILFVLSALHVFWAAGGQWGSRVAVPEVGALPGRAGGIGSRASAGGSAAAWH
jgi:hypothetical protein